MRNLLNKIAKWLKGDRALHLMLSTALVVILFGFFENVFIATLIALAIGFAKEFIYDKWMKKGCFEWEDIIADTIGVAIGLAYCVWIVFLV